MPLYVAVPGLIAVALLGWLTGMLTFERSLVWCAVCHDELACPRCTRQPSTEHLATIRRL